MRKNWLSTVSLVAVVVLSACSSTPTTTPVPTPGVTFVPKGTREPVQSAVTATPRPLGAPMLVDHAPLRGEALRLDQPLELQFDQPMDRGSVEKSVAVVDASGAAVNGAFEWTSDAVVRFTPAQPWGRAAQYRVQVGAESRSAKGIGLARRVHLTSSPSAAWRWRRRFRPTALARSTHRIRLRCCSIGRWCH